MLAYTDRDDEDPEVVDLTALAAALQPMLRAGTGPELELRFHNHDAPLPVRIDRARVEQVFLNLALNARDALAGRGSLRVEVTRARPGDRAGTGHWFGHVPTAPRDYAVTRFTDDGEGMSAETIGRMFDPFFSTRFPGRGLGLAAAFGIVRRHDGLFEVHSQPGQGTTFAVWLPIAETAATSSTDDPAAGRPPAPAGRVLVIDDEQAILDIGERMLRRQGWQVTTARSAAAALDALRAGAAFDCILLDFSIPDVDGGRLLQELAALAPDTPIVVSSGHDEGAVRAQLPVDCPFLAKPFTMASLRAALERATSGRR
ncbi:MAG: response regulator [Planctomycetota bacterium]